MERAYRQDDSPDTLKMKRKTEEISAQAPEGMSEAQFEIWLWMLNEGSESSADARSNDPWAALSYGLFTGKTESDSSSFDSCDSTVI